MDLKCEDHFKYRGPKKVSVVWSVGDGDIFKRVLLTGASEARIMEFKSKKILRLSVAIATPIFFTYEGCNINKC